MMSKKFKFWTSMAVLAPCLLGLILWNQLPDQMPTHFGMDGSANDWSSKAFAVFGIPLMMLAFHWICLAAMHLDKRNIGNSNEKVLKIVALIFPVISAACAGITYSTALEQDWNLNRLMFIGMGLMFVALGNYLPKCRQNATLGIKLKWTLYNEENWNKTHRFGGKCWVIGGICFFALSFASEKWLMAGLVSLMAVFIGAPMLYSWLLYKKQVREGTWVQSETSKEFIYSKMGRKASCALRLVILVGVAAIMFTGNIRYELQEEQLEISATFATGSHVPYDRIESVELREEGVSGSRQMGFGSARLLLGSFRNEEFGNYIRYTYTGQGPCLVVKASGQILVLGGENENATRELYRQLLEKTGH